MPDVEERLVKVEGDCITHGVQITDIKEDVSELKAHLDRQDEKTESDKKELLAAINALATKVYNRFDKYQWTFIGILSGLLTSLIVFKVWP